MTKYIEQFRNLKIKPPKYFYFAISFVILLGFLYSFLPKISDIASHSMQLSSKGVIGEVQHMNAFVCDGNCATPQGKISSLVSNYLNNPVVLEKLVQSYEESDRVALLEKDAKQIISYRTKGRILRLRTWSTRKCLRFVKKALAKAGLVTSDRYGNPDMNPNPKFARSAGKALKEQGFINLLETPYKEKIQSPYDAPLGSVLIYDGGIGHSEIRTKDGFISDYFSDTARTGSPENGYSGRHRKLIGVYIKLDLNGEA